MLDQIEFNLRQTVFRICTLNLYSAISWKLNQYLPHPISLLSPVSPKSGGPFMFWFVAKIWSWDRFFLFNSKSRRPLSKHILYYSFIHIYKYKHNNGVNGKGYLFLARRLPYTILKNVLLKVEIISCCKKQSPVSAARHSKYLLLTYLKKINHKADIFSDFSLTFK